MIFGTPTGVFGSPEMIFGSPAAVFGSPEIIFGTPTGVFGSPEMIFGTTTEVFGSPKMVFGTTKMTDSLRSEYPLAEKIENRMEEKEKLNQSYDCLLPGVKKK